MEGRAPTAEGAQRPLRPEDVRPSTREAQLSNVLRFQPMPPTAVAGGPSSPALAARQRLRTGLAVTKPALSTKRVQDAATRSPSPGAKPGVGSKLAAAALGAVGGEGSRIAALASGVARGRSGSNNHADSAAAAPTTSPSSPLLSTSGKDTFLASLSHDPRFQQLMASAPSDPNAFLYLVPTQGNHYDLRIVSSSEVNRANYYTLSHKGIMHFCGRETEFMSIYQFERQYYLYTAAKRIPFFEKFRVWKAFTEWKRNIVRRKQRKCRAALSKNLFILQPLLADPILQLRALCMRVETGLNAWSIDGAQTYKLDEFCDLQHSKAIELMQELAEFGLAVRQRVYAACASALHAYLEENGFEGGSLEQGGSAAEHAAEPSSTSFTERAAMRTYCRRLARFVRMVDFFFVDSALTLSFRCLQELQGHVRIRAQAKQQGVAQESASKSLAAASRLASVKSLKQLVHQPVLDKLKRAEQPEPLFVVSMRLDDGQRGITYKPPLDEVLARVEELVNSAIKVTTRPLRLLTHPDMGFFVEPAVEEHGAVGEGMDLETMVKDDPRFHDAMDALHRALECGFRCVDDYIRVFAPYRNAFFANQDALARMTLEECKDWAPKQFQEAMQQYATQREEFQGIPVSGVAELVRVDSAELRSLLLPSPQRCLDALRDLLPQAALLKNATLLQETSEAHGRIAANPTSVESFVEVMSFLQRTQEGMAEYEARYRHVQQLYELMEQLDIPISDELASNNYVLMKMSQQLKEAMEHTESTAEANTQRFSRELNENIPKLRSRISEVQRELARTMLTDADSRASDMVRFLTGTEATVAELEALARRYAHYQDVLRIRGSEFTELEEVRADLSIKAKLWQAVQDWEPTIRAWVESPFAALDAEGVGKTVQLYLRTATQAERALSGSAAASLKRQVQDFADTLPVVSNLRTAALAERHWARIHELVGYEIHGVDDFTLGTLIERRAGQHAEAIEAIATEAVQEAVLEQMLDKVRDTWAAAEFELVQYKDTKDVILGSVEEAVSLLDDSLVNINTILGSRYVGGIRDRVDEWRRKLVLVQDTLEEWMQCQRNWLYLETIFAAPDIQRQLPEESAQFANVDTSWRTIMRQTRDEPNCLRAATRPSLKETFAKHNATLDAIQKSLEDYLETKRAAFPRFYFLANDELLEILAQTKDPHAVQPHLCKCFDNLVRLEFGDELNSADIMAMMSSEGEQVALTRNLKARGKVEDWLGNVEKSMRTALYQLMKVGLQQFEVVERKRWVREHPGQVVATVAQIMWSRGTEDALQAARPVQAMREWHAQNVADLADLTGLVRSDLTRLERKVIVALVTTDVHARDIVEGLAKHEVDSINNFAWQQQLRYYWDTEADDVVVRQSNTSIRYAYEYEGCTSRLVITPLTDRCWMTLTGALHLKLGAAPAGPAGTGKTESSKDLAKALGVQCIVFNCSDQIDYKMMGKLFAGLAQAGCWTCLDEFNRIDIEVLSVVAQQLLVLRQGRLAGAETVVFEGRQICLNEHHVIITMNPGYAGRTELPDNLKVLFRPVAMMVPDYALIAEIMLFAEGFDDAKTLSRKMTRLYILCSEQLSQQCHYDYGLRAVKSVLVMAGGLKRGNPQLSEDVVLIRALRDSNVPKFLADDLPLFFGILTDLFPGVKVPYQDTGELRRAVEEELVVSGMQVVPTFVDKLIQLYETMNVRFGVTLVGPTGSGKTVAYRALAQSMTALRDAGSADDAYQRVHVEVLNPKCITMGELYGEFNELTQEWTDGLASSIMRRAATDDSEDKRWTVFDGPIDALWIENMNTVLDDNMTLCLANGERIKLRPQMKMLFEVQDLNEASPATVSRLGVVYCTTEQLGWLPYVQSWWDRTMAHASMDIKARFFSNMDKLFQRGLDFVRRSCTEPIPTTDLQLATSFCELFSATFSANNGVEFVGTAPDVLRDLADKSFAFAYAFSLGGALDSRCAPEFHEASREIFHNQDPPIALPNTDTMLHYFVDVGERDFRHFSEVVPEFQFDAAAPYFRLMVPTVDTVRYTFCLKQLLLKTRPVFFTGITGTGKTMVIQHLLEHMSVPVEDGGHGVVPLAIGFSAQTSSRVTQLTIEAKLEKKRKTLLGAPVNKRVVVSVDDVNMPAVEQYGAQPPVELLRQFLDCHGFYDREKLFWKDIESVCMVAAAAPPGGGRSRLTPRFTRHFNLFCLPPADHAVMALIFNSILAGFLEGFAPEIQELCPAVVASTIEVFNRISAELLPTPKKSHYTFNLRDISKVFQGVLMITPKRCAQPRTLVRLWVHEAMRVFHDRLVDEADKGWFTALAVDLLARNFKLSWTHDELFGEAPPLFCHFLRRDADVPLYEECADTDKLVRVLDEYLEDYNLSHPSRMHLVFFQDAVEHVCRVARVLRQKRGNAMLVGVGGSGKQSLTRLACFICGMECVQIEVKRGYAKSDFREDLKGLMRKTGVAGQPTTFLFTDTQIIHESFLEDINNVLNSGEVPNLFPPDEMDQVINQLRPVVKDLGIVDTRDNCKAAFVERVRDNLHVVLAMSPVGDALRVRCRQFPSLINCCTIDWYLPWPRAALQSVAERFLADVELPDEAIRPALAQCCMEVHASMLDHAKRFFDQLRRHVYTTPKSYLDMIQLYLSILQEKRSEKEAGQQRLSIGIKKLTDTNAMVEGLRDDLTKLQPVLEQKQLEAEDLLREVAQEQADAEVVKNKVAEEERMVSEKAAEISEVQAEAQQELDVAMPALLSAVDALNALDKKDITEMKSFAKPPPAVQVVMEAVCLLLGEKTDWDSAKRVMSNANFIRMLQDFDKDNIPQATLKKLKKYVENPIMKVANVKKVSKAATSLCMWAHAMDVYAAVAKEVEPKRQRLEELNEQLSSANAVLAEKQAELQAVVHKVNALQQRCEETVGEKERLREESERTRLRLVRAEKLTSGLADEGVRWQQSVESIMAELVALIGDVFLAAACISYCGAFTGPFRQEIVNGWETTVRQQSVPLSASFSLARALGDPVRIRDWQIAGLPTDAVSTDNAILVTRGKRWPLMVDPQGQANRWVKNVEGKTKMDVTKLSNPKLLTALEGCVRNGRALLIEDVGEQLDPGLEPVLNRAVFKNGTRTLIRIGDADVDYDDAFRLYITTKLPNPHYTPEVCIKVTIINFTVTMQGLEDQLLGTVVSKERQDIEMRRSKLISSMAADRKKLKETEDEILRMLSESAGNILDDEELINALANSKTVSAMISERVVESEKTEAEINDMREQYRAVATRASIIYFVVADLADVDPMYQYSLDYFSRLFSNCIDDSEPSEELATRLTNIVQYLTQHIFQVICRGLFEAHKLLFAFLICAQILRNSGQVQDPQWMALLRPSAVPQQPPQLPNPDPSVLSKTSWALLDALEIAMPDTFAGMCENATLEWHEWAGFLTHPEPHTQAAPAWARTKVTPFQQLLIIKAVREEALLSAISHFVATQLGPDFVRSAAVSMHDIHASMSKKTPCIFVLSTGADPTGRLLRLAQDMGYRERLHVISLGQGQGPKAEALVREAAKIGDWVLLQNCHLAKSWMPTLEKLVLDLEEKQEKVHAEFRLFLTSFPAPYFPVPVLQNGVKLTNEPPRGLKANLQRTFGQLVHAETLESCSKPHEWHKLLFGLCFFHAVVQERRKFGALGWNIKYEFNDSDLETSMQVLKMFLEEQEEVPWDALRYVTGQINYGGRVTDDWDRRCIMSILNRFYTPDILQEEHAFSPSGTYHAPPRTDFRGLSAYIESLPHAEPPEVFGLHENANIAYLRQETAALLTTALSVQPRVAAVGGGKTNDDVVLEVAEEIQRGVPALLQREEAGPKTFIVRANGLVDSLGTVLLQEMAKFNSLLRAVSLTLQDLQRAIRGLVVMSADLDCMYISFLNNQVPALWSAVAYPSLKPLASWVKDLQWRMQFMRQWLREGQPVAFPLPVFFFPQGFATGTLQVHARKYAIPINSLSFTFRIYDCEVDELREAPEDGIVVYGLWLEGARWDMDNARLADSKPAQMFARVPPIHFLPAQDHEPDPAQYACPVYKTTERRGVLSTTGMSTNFVVAVHLPTDRTPDYWVWRGAAFMLNLDD